MRCLSLCFLAFFALGAEPTTRPATTQASDMDKIQGVWNQTNLYQAWQYEFKGDKLVHRTGPKRLEAATYDFTIDPTKSPKTIDWGDGYVGIYEFRGELLRIIGEAKDRPKTFGHDD